MIGEAKGGGTRGGACSVEQLSRFRLIRAFNAVQITIPLREEKAQGERCNIVCTRSVSLVCVCYTGFTTWRR